MKNRILLSILSLSLPFLVSAKIISVDITGHGNSINKAIENSLIQAVQQINGVTIKSDSAHTVREVINNNDTDYGETTGQQYQLNTKGVIKHYKVNSSSCKNNTCIAELTVAIDKKEVIASNRKIIAIDTFTGKRATRLKNKLDSYLVQARKFAVVESLQHVNLDYYVKANVRHAFTNVNDHAKNDAVTGEVKKWKTYYSEIVVDYKVVSAKTGQVRWKDSVKTFSSRNNLIYLTELTAKKMFTVLHGNIFPLRIAAIEDNRIIIASGGNTVNRGERYDVFKMGKIIRDPYTKEIIGQSETKVGTIKIGEVLAKISYADVVYGNIQVFSASQILRKLKPKASKKKTSSPKKNPEPIIPVTKGYSLGKSGGIIL